jgi:hypothetical protein
MADNFAFTEGSGKTGAADDIGGVLYPRVKVTWGPDATANDADTASGKALPVQLRESDGTDVAIGGKLGALAEAAPATDTASSGLNGRLQRIAQRLTTLISSTIAISAASLPLPSGAATETTLGTRLSESDFDTKSGSLTEAAPAIDTASSGLNGRLQRIAQRLTSLIALLPTSLGANGGLKIEGVASGTVVPVSLASVPSHAVTNAGTFAVQATEADGANATLGAKGDAKSSASDTTSITIMQVLKQISFSIQAAAASLAGTLTVASHAVTNAGTFAVQAASAGDVASGSSDSGNPLKIGAVARSAEPSATTDGFRKNVYSDLVGKLIVLPYANPENFVSGAITSAMTGTTSTSLVAAPAAGLRNYITTIIVSNAHATVGTDVVIQDGTGGTTLMTIPAAAVYGGSVINLPVPLRQPTTATAIFCANVTTGASTKVSAVGYKGA